MGKGVREESPEARARGQSELTTILALEPLSKLGPQADEVVSVESSWVGARELASQKLRKPWVVCTTGTVVVGPHVIGREDGQRKVRQADRRFAFDADRERLQSFKAFSIQSYRRRYNHDLVNKTAQSQRD